MKKTSLALAALFTATSFQLATAGDMVESVNGKECYEDVTFNEMAAYRNGERATVSRSVTGEWDKVTLYKSGKNNPNPTWSLVGRLPAAQAASIATTRTDRQGVVCEISSGANDSYKQNSDYRKYFVPQP